MEQRMMMSSTVLAAWDFDTLSTTTTSTAVGLTSPPPTSGVVAGGSTAYTVGMANTSSTYIGGSTNNATYYYTYPAAGAAANYDDSSYLLASGSADTGANGGSAENISSGSPAIGSDGYVWYIQKGQSQNASVGSQGIQLNVPTTGFTGISISFDMNPSSVKAESQFIVEYTTDIQDANPNWTNVTQDLTFGPGNLPDSGNSGHVATIGNSSSNDIELQTNTPGTAGYNANLASGTYATILGPVVGGSNTAWLNDLQVDLSVNDNFTSANNAPNFAFRVVNAGTGLAESNISQAIANTTSATGFKNWRFNEIHVTAANAATPTAPIVQTSPQSATVNATSVVSFTSTASGYPLPSEQWQVSYDHGATFQTVSGTNVPNASNFYNSSTFTITSATAAESGAEFRAVFNNGVSGTGTDSANNIASGAATLTVNPIFAPTVTANPTSVTTNGTNTVTFTSTAAGNPTPTEQWQFEPSGGTTFTNVSSGGLNVSSYSFTASATASGTYRAVFNNSQGSATSTAATLTVYSKPTVITSPLNQTVGIPNAVTFTAVGLADVIPTVTWQYQPSGGTGFVNVSSGSASVAGGTSAYNTVNGTATFTFTPVRADSGDQFRAVFNDAAGSINTSSATLTVLGTAIADWTFPTTETAPYDTPSPTIGNGTLTSLGMQNDFNPGTASSGAYDDILSTSGTIDSNYTENTWRVRGGSIQGTGSPEGWSSFAPDYQYDNAAYAQGIEVQVPTTGYSNVYVHYDWYSTTEGPRNAVVQYTTDGSTWQTYTFPGGSNYLINPGNDYYGSSNATTPPTGVTLNFSSIPAANNNPEFAIRMVDAYQQDTNPSASDYLPDIYDGNNLITDSNGNPVAHAQYGTANATEAANTIQEIQIGGDSTTLSGNFTLTVPTANGPETTGVIAYSNAYPYASSTGTYTSTLANSIQSALAALPGLKGTTVTYNDGMASNFIVEFPGTVAAPGVVDGKMTSNINPAGYAGLTGSVDQAEATAFANDPDAAPNESGSPSVNIIYSGSLIPYSIAGSGNWRFGNIDVTGDSGAPGIFVEPVSQTVELTSANPTQSVTFTAEAYSADPGLTVQWDVSTDGGMTFNPVTNGSSGTSITPIAGSNGEYSSSYTFTANTTQQTGYQFEAVFTDPTNSATGTTTAATLLVVQPTAPSIVTQPLATTTVAGGTAVFSTLANGLPLDSADTTTTWQLSSGSGWTNVPATSAVTTYSTLSTGYASESSTLALTSSLAQNGSSVRCVITNAYGTATTSAVILTVLPVETTVTQWNFGGTSSTGVIPAGTGVSAAAPYTGGVNNPTPNISTAPATLSTVGFIDGTTTPASVPAADVDLTGGTADPSFATNTWRIRGGPTPSTPNSQNVDGWDASAPEYTQGAEIDVNATNLQDLYLSFQWFATTSAIRDLQVQYCLNTTAGSETWVNLGNPYIATANDYYGESSVTSGNSTVPNAPTGVVVNLTNVAGTAGDASLGIRLVSAYDPALGNQYASASTVNGVVQPYTTESGNWRFGDIQVSGVAVIPTWLSPASSSVNGGPAVWNYFTQTLTVASGTATIIGDPAISGDSPNLVISGASTTLNINSAGGNEVNIGSLNVSGGATVAMTSSLPNILIVSAGGTFSIDNSSRLNLNTDFLDVQAGYAAQGAADLASVSSLVARGYNNGNWNGHGIVSSAAATSPGHLLGVGVIENNGVYGSGQGTLGQFDNFTPGANDVLVRETYYGDANLDGRVDGSDYSQIDNGYHNHLTGWVNGDFNYDNVVDGTDYSLIDNAFNNQGAALPADQVATATVAAQVASVAPATSGKTADKSKATTGTTRAGSTFVPNVFQTANPIAFPGLADNNLELSLKKKDRLDALSLSDSISN